MNKKILIVGVVVLLAAIGVIVGVVVSKGSDSSTKDGNKSTDNAGADGQTGGNGGADGDSNGGGNNGGNGGSATRRPTDPESSGSEDGGVKPTQKPKLESDPREQSYSLTALAIGDWGTTLVRDSCCKRRKDGKFNNNDVHAEDIVATLMDAHVASMPVKPKVVIGHGDNFYWTGINSIEGRDSRFQTTFEDKFSGAHLQDIPWVNVFGNHDYGGSSYICSSGDEPAPCSSPEELVKALNDKMEFQRSYKSPNGDRWIMKDHFYVHTIEDPASGVSIDIYNMDTNDAEAHGARQICCQCYGYASGSKDCSQAIRGESRCAGGSTAMYDACYDQLMKWGDESRAALKQHAMTSNATWKIVNSHYSPYAHYTDSRFDMWFDLLKESKVNVWLYGHTHGEKHDYSPYLETHFIENGAGGGIQSESASGIVPSVLDKVMRVWSWGAHQYGFFSLEASKEWLKVQYHTYPGDWMAGDDFNKGAVPSPVTHHCWYIPVNGLLGQVCDASKEFPPASAEALEDQ